MKKTAVNFYALPKSIGVLFLFLFIYLFFIFFLGGVINWKQIYFSQGGRVVKWCKFSTDSNKVLGSNLLAG